MKRKLLKTILCLTLVGSLLAGNMSMTSAQEVQTTQQEAGSTEVSTETEAVNAQEATTETETTVSSEQATEENANVSEKAVESTSDSTETEQQNEEQQKTDNTVLDSTESVTTTEKSTEDSIQETTEEQLPVVGNLEEDALGISQSELDSSAVALTLNSATTGVLSSKYEEDWYKFTIGESGYFNIYLGCSADADADNVGRGWTMSIYKKGNLNDSLVSYDRIVSSQTSEALPFAPGEYYVKIESYYTYEAPVGCNYDIKANFVKSAYWESEYNNVNANANEIATNTTYSGDLYNANDVDWYKFSTPANGYFQINLKADDAADTSQIGRGWTVEVYDSSFNILKTYSNIKSEITGSMLPFQKGTYYIRVLAYYTYEAPTGCIYDLKVLHTASGYYESEGNNTNTLANAISLNNEYRGNLYYSDDADWFKFKVSAKGTVKISLSMDNDVNVENIGWGWDLRIYKANATEAFNGIYKVKNSNSLSLELGKGTYYIKVSPNYRYSAPVDCTYVLKTGYAKVPATAKMTSAKAASKSVKLSWKKVSGATGYVIYRSTSKNGTYKKVTTIKKGSTVSYTNKSLKKGKTYYYKIKSYISSNGATSYSGYSNIKNARAK